MIPLKQDLMCLKFKSKSVVSVIVVMMVFLSACDTKTGNKTEKKEGKSSYELLAAYLSEFPDNLQIDKYRIVLFLTESGCSSCNNRFSSFIQDKMINKDSVLIIVNAKGGQINIRPYLSDTINNIVTDFTSDFYRLGLLEGTGFINLKDNKIDSIVKVEPERINEQLLYLQSLSE